MDEDKAEDVDNDGDDGDDDVDVIEDEGGEEVEDVGRIVEDSSSSFRLVRRLSSGTKLSAALSCIFVEKITSHVVKDKKITCCQRRKDGMLPKTKK